MTVNNPQAHSLVDCVHQVMYNMLATKDIDKKVFDYIYIWVETLSYIA